MFVFVLSDCFFLRTCVCGCITIAKVMYTTTLASQHNEIRKMSRAIGKKKDNHMHIQSRLKSCHFRKVPNSKLHLLYFEERRKKSSKLYTKLKKNSPPRNLTLVSLTLEKTPYFSPSTSLTPFT